VARALHVDLPHLFLAIVEGLDAEIQWPDAAQRKTLATTCTGIFHHCVGIMDITEVNIKRSKDLSIECDTFLKTKAGHTKRPSLP
jgi:hypothetical protein